MIENERLAQLSALGGDIAALVKEVTELRSILSKPPAPTKEPESPLRIDNAVFVRAVTHYHTGRIVKLTEQEVVLADAAWIASTGRFSAALTSGVLDEIEPYPGLVSIGRGAIVDVTDWLHALPRGIK